jgi:hypothetical protein
LNMRGAIWRMYISSVWYLLFCGVGFGGVQARPLHTAWTVTRMTRARDMIQSVRQAGVPFVRQDRD